MLNIARPPRATYAVAILLIVLPLAVTLVVKYLPALTGHAKFTSLGILRPNVIGPEEYSRLETDITARLHEALAEAPGISVRDLASEATPAKPADPGKLAADAGTDAVIVPTLTVDAGIVQLNLQVIDARSGRIVFNTPYQSSLQNYPEMMKAACAALKRALF
jgi:TolB-like protein